MPKRSMASAPPSLRRGFASSICKQPPARAGGHHNGENDQEYFFHVQFVLQVSPNSVYAIIAGKVPKGCQSAFGVNGAARRLLVEAGWIFPRENPGRTASARNTEATEAPRNGAPEG